jgi:hypothetical protein
MKQCTINFLNAVTDPFKTVNAARVPDLQKQASICMRDYIDDYTLNAAEQAGDNVVGLLIYWHYGPNVLRNLDAANSVGSAWACTYIYITSNGLVLVENIGWFQPVNASVIMGLSSGVGTQSGLAQAFRIFAGGLKVLPSIETITSDSTLAVRNFWGGTCTPADIENLASSVSPEEKSDFMSVRSSFSSKHSLGTGNRRGFTTLGATATSTSVFEAVVNWNNVREFPNSKGITVRYDPFQFQEQLDYINYQNLNMSTTGTRNRFDTSHIDFPFVLVRFTDQGIPQDGLLPIRIFASYWLETILVKPTPIYSVKSPVDWNYPKIRAMMSDTSLYPLVVEGHSFLPFIAQAGRLAREIRQDARELRPAIKLVKQTGRGVVRAIAGLNRIANKKKKKKRKRRRKRRAMARAQRGNLLPGVARDGFKVTMGPN